MTGRWLMGLGAVAAVGLFASTQAATAGTPYTCNCAGKKTRFIGGSYACKILRNDPKDQGVPPRRRRACTAKEHAKFVLNACAASKCKPWHW